MTFSCVINTCALAQGAAAHAGPSGIPYAQRHEFIQYAILPRLLNDPLVETIVISGEYQYGDGYVYQPCFSTYHNCRDVLAQRHAGWLKARGTEYVLFLMDDHVPEDKFFETALGGRAEHAWDVLSPNRRSHATRADLNSGWNGVGSPDPVGPYTHTHGIVMTQQAIRRCPWDSLTPIYRFDVLHSWWFADQKLRVGLGYDTYIEDLES